MRIFLDANILFSAAKDAGAIRALLQHAKHLGHSLVADAYVVAEAERNLKAKYASSIPDWNELLRILEVSESASTGNLPKGISEMLPKKDQPVLLAAIALCCDVLVTGDKTHFGALYGKTFDGVTIHSPSSLYEKAL